MNILIVDDTADIREFLSTAFEVNNHHVVVAEDGMQALEAAQLLQFDAVIMDIAMPTLDGWQATQRLRRMLGYATVPIILLTGHAHLYEADKGKEAGATLLLHKPVDALMLVEMTEGLVEVENSSDSQGTEIRNNSLEGT
ncbi:MAG TPA: response regulator [Abditibacteriaceae bacterium]|jgi:CheY-like chemotaxis protein